ncbi:sulfotransferase family protein [Rhodovulum bhavnagarense]|uniref:Sulfotransferase family protein n=1 Tax=Rhodovulum bhavnagarense TaxID=992286 RepID=A0A4R2R8Z8_9RHOB|nr:sulfotransferase family 2 domain-containing protein [Rhodovulum bhavnagarense]TCP58409.1 sulfotransferase family protein [Rhodovulum bhavnagarense]
MFTPNFTPSEFRRPTTHYMIEANGQRILYAYIRKNACTSFRRFIAGHSLRGMIAPGKLPDLDISAARVPRPGPTERLDLILSFDRRIFIYRDPVDRFISTFANKFIDNSAARDIQNKFKKYTGIEVEDATFLDFLRYAQQDFRYLDCHLWPQKSHLWDIPYTDAIELNFLKTSLVNMIGAKHAAAWFGATTNASKTSQNKETRSLFDYPVSELRTIAKREVISKHSFQAPTLARMINEKYASDYDMINKIEKLKSAKYNPRR